MSAALGLTLAALPALAAWWWGRGLRAEADGPLLPERLAAYRGRLGIVAVLSWLIGSVVSGAPALVLPVGVLALLAAFYPVRRALYSESWSLAAYLSHSLRLALGMAGFWILLAATPALVWVAAERRWLVASVLGVVLLSWAAMGQRLLLALLGARPLGREELATRLDEVAARARVRAPFVLEAGPQGGRWANAFALPGWRRGRVLFTHTLLVALAPEETAAIFAHELAHLEHFDRRRLLKAWAAQALLVAAGAFGSAALLDMAGASQAPGVVAGLLWLWALVVPTSVAAGLVRHRRHEAESDLRAAELCGDPEALIRALVKLHELQRVPRRVPSETEQRSTHPSLARRIQALQRAGSAPQLERPLLLASPEPGSFVALDAGRSHWLWGIPAGTSLELDALRSAASRTMSYAHGELAELRIAEKNGVARLLARDRSGGRLEMPIRREDLPAVQATLDRLDTRLASAAPPPSRASSLGAIAALAVLLAVLVRGAGVAVVAGAATLARGGTGSFSALGAVLVLEALRGWGGSAGLVRAGCVVLGVAGLALLVLSLRAPGDRSRGAGLAAVVLGGFGTLGLLLVLVTLGFPSPLVQLHRAARMARGAGVALAGSAVALACLGRRSSRALAGVAAAAGLGLLLVGSPAATPFASDRLFGAPALVTPAPEATALVFQRTFDMRVGELRVSPTAATLALRPAREPREDGALQDRFLIFTKDGPAGELLARDLAFLDERRLALLVPVEAGLEVRVAEIGATTSTLLTRLPDVDQGRIDAGDEGRTIVVTGLTHAEVRRWVWEEGGGLVDARWPRRGSDDGDEDEEGLGGEVPVVGRTGSPLVLEARFTGWYAALAPLAAFTGVWPLRMELLQLGPSGPEPLSETVLFTRCSRRLAATDAAICLGQDDERTLVSSVDALGRIEPLAQLPGTLVSEAIGPGGRIALWRWRRPSSWLDMTAGRNADLVLLETRERPVRARALELPGARIGELALSRSALAVLTRDAGGGTSVSVYALPPAPLP